MAPAAVVTLALSVLFAGFSSRAAASSYEIGKYYVGTDSTCSNETPYFSIVPDDDSCGTELCDTPYGDRTTTECTDNYKAYVECMSNRAPYLLEEMFISASECAGAAFKDASATPATGDCVGRPGNYAYRYARVVIEANGSVTINSYNGSSCRDEYLADVTVIAADLIESYSCDSTTKGIPYEWKFSIYTGGNSTTCGSIRTSSDKPSPIGSTGTSRVGSHSESRSSSTSISEDGLESTPPQSPSPETSLSTGTIVGIVAGGIAIVLLLVLLLTRRRRGTLKTFRESDQFVHDAYLNIQSQGTQPLRSETFHSDITSSLSNAPPTQVKLWEDDAITTSRISRDQIQFQRRLSQGAYGEVYLGIYDGEYVAVKMLRPEMRKNVSQINDFLAEVMLTASMEHPHIVRFIGVAWKMLADLCAVMEYMEGGDLRLLLNNYLSDGIARGFNRDKATIAFQVCHALTYMHSLSTPVIHRDLKSRNILLTRDLQAKLIDFGISRERLDSTMTAGVGTMLWMAPEVMMGEKYDEKADMFSFGVVLSELDVHTLPYASAKAMSKQFGVREESDAAIVQQVAMGKLRVEFSDASPKAVVELGCECVSLDPARRPTASQALYRLQVLL